MNELDGLLVTAGRWHGSNTLQDPTTGHPEASPSTATITPVLGGRFVRLDYTWAYQGKPQEGSVVLGFEPKSGEISGHWIDSWHMGRKAMICLGTSSPGTTISIRGIYAAPPGPDWGWRIEILPGADALRITHKNIDPDGKEELAAEGVYTRVPPTTATPQSTFFRSAGPIGETDIDALPVKEIGPAVGYYTQVRGFSLVERDHTTARLRRDDVRIGLSVNGRDPEQASCWFSVSDVDVLWRELNAKGAEPGIIDEQEYDGKPYRVF